MKIIFFEAILVLSLLGLSECRECPACVNPPLYVTIRILDDKNVDLLYSRRYNHDSLEIYYVEQNTKKKIKFDLDIDSVHQRVIIGSENWCQKSFNGIKKYYLKLNNQSIDTVLFDVIERGDKCCKNPQIERFEINGIKLSIDSIGYSYIYKK